MKKYLSLYYAHYGVGLLVSISFVLSGFKFNIIQSSHIFRIFYCFIQVFSLIFFLSFVKETLKTRFKFEKRIFYDFFAIIIGTFFSVTFDYFFIYSLNFLKINIVFQDDIGKHDPIYLLYITTYFKSLKYPIIFWPLCEIIHYNIRSLQKIIYIEEKTKSNILNSFKFLKSIPPIERDNLLAIEAQQNYIRVILKDRSYTVLYRLKDAISEIPPEIGMQIHRSYWVRFNDLNYIIDGNKLKLINDEVLPISRTYLREAKEAFQN